MNLNATLIGQLIAFVLFVAFCMKYVWPPLIKAIEERQANIANALASAEKAKQEQADSKAEADKEILKAKEEAQKIIDLATKRRNEILESVQAEAEVNVSVLLNKVVRKLKANVNVFKKSFVKK